METLIIEAKELMQGISTNDWIADAGYSPLSKGINPWYEKGVLNFQPVKLDLATLSSNVYLDGNAIASIPDPNSLSNVAYVLTDTGTFYTVDGSFAYLQRQQDTAHTYAFGSSDIKWFSGAFYATSQTNITRITGASLQTAIDATWWTVTKSKAALTSTDRHPMEIVEDTLYIADNIYLHTVDTAGTVVSQAITLPMVITEIRKHPNGRDLIAFCINKLNYSGSEKVDARAYIINTVTLEYSSEIMLDDQVVGSILVGGIIYVAYGTNLGYFTDNGIVFLRELDLPYPLNGVDLPYKHHLGNMEGTLLVAERNRILALGDLGKGKVFFYPLVSDVITNRITTILPIGSKRIIYGQLVQTAGNKTLYKVDYTTNSLQGTLPTFYTNKYSFPKKAWIRKIEVIHNAFTTGQTLYIYDTSYGNSVTLGLHDNTNYPGEKISRFDVNVNTDNFQLALNLVNSTGVNSGIKKIIIYYELGED